MFKNIYKPDSFDKLIFQNDIARKKLSNYASGKRTGNILLHGPCGTSKSTTAMIIARDSRPAHIQGFDWGVQTVKCGDFKPDQLANIKSAWVSSYLSFEYAVFDEFDQLNMDNQHKVRALLDDYEGKRGIIMTTNYLRRVDPAIQSRCDVVEMPKLNTAKLLPLCKSILHAEGITMATEDIEGAIEHEDGSFRNILRQLEFIVQEANAKAA
jgi:replication factor C subunit 3/5